MRETSRILSVRRLNQIEGRLLGFLETKGD